MNRLNQKRIFYFLPFVVFRSSEGAPHYFVIEAAVIRCLCGGREESATRRYSADIMKFSYHWS